MILMVDDELAICELMKARLEIEGFEVITAANGLDGLQRYQENKDRVEIVITDLDMPAMNGVDMIQHIVKITPTMKVIVASASSRTYASEEEAGIKASCLQKPYTARELTEAVHQLLSTRPPEIASIASDCTI